MHTNLRKCYTNLLFGLTVLPLTWLLFDVSGHGEGSAVMAVSQVDDIGDGGQHGALAAGAYDVALLTHSQQQLRNTEEVSVSGA